MSIDIWLPDKRTTNKAHNVGMSATRRTRTRSIFYVDFEAEIEADEVVFLTIDQYMMYIFAVRHT